MTADLSLEAKGAWIALRMRLCVLQTYVLELDHERLARLLRCTLAQVTTILKEFEWAIGCGFRVEKPPPYGKNTEIVRLVYERDEKVVLSLSSESVRVSKYREDKKKQEKIRMPENWDLNEKMREYARLYGMCTDTVRHEFEHCKTRHAESVFTVRGWEQQVWQTWVLNWKKFGSKQITADATDPQAHLRKFLARGT